MNCSDLHKQWYTDSCLDESRYMVSIRLMLPHEWHLHREVRLQALLDAPHAFGSSYEAEAKRSNYEWQQVIETALASGKNHVNLAESDGVVCGLVWCKLSDRETGLAEIFQMWVNPKHRGMGVGEKLLQAAIGCARNHSMERIGLEVTATNSAAAAFYQSQGFQQVGEIELTNVASEDTHAFLLQL